MLNPPINFIFVGGFYFDSVRFNNFLNYLSINNIVDFICIKGDNTNIVAL